MTRRALLLAGLAAPVGAVMGRRMSFAGQGLGQFTTAGPPTCTDARTLTPKVSDDREFKPGSPARTSIADPGTPGKKLVLTGAVIGLKCGAIKGAIVDVWQADTRGAYDMAGFHLRGHQTTDVNGRYHVETIKPGAAGGRAPRICVKVHPPGKPILATQVFLSTEAANAKDSAVKPELIAKVTEDHDVLTARFDFILDQ